MITLYKEYNGTTILLSSEISLVKKAIEEGSPAILLITNENRFDDTSFVRYAFEIEEYRQEDYDDDGKYIGLPCTLDEDEILSMLGEEEQKRLVAKSLGQRVIIAETENLLIQELSQEDIIPMIKMYEEDRNPFLEPFFDNVTNAHEIIEKYINEVYDFYGYGIWGVYHKGYIGTDEDSFIGICGFTPRDVGELRLYKGEEYETTDENEMDLELGYAIRQQFRRKGYAYEACSAIIKYAKENISYNMIFVNIDPDNTAAMALAKKLGIDGALAVKEYKPDKVFKNISPYGHN